MRKLPDQQITENVASFVRAGAYQWVAAVASGISKAKFSEWMSGTTVEEQEFQFAVHQAAACARVATEIVVAKKNPLAWLMRGPGREKPDEPGWTSQVAVTGPKGGALESIVTAAAEPKEDYSRLTVDELRQLRALRDRVRVTAPPTPAAQPQDDDASPV